MAAPDEGSGNEGAGQAVSTPFDIFSVSGPKGLMGQMPPAAQGRKGWPWTEQTDPSVYAGRRDWPRISIVTPSYNQGQFLEETIRSVLLQNYPNLQYIVIDGGSTDGSVEIIKKYEPWIDSWVSEKDRGQSHAINKGLERCNGVWFNWLNSDDYLLPGAWQALLEEKNLEERWVVSGKTNNVGLSQGESSYGARFVHEWPRAMFFLHVNQPGALLRLAEVRACGGIRENLRLVMDLSLWLHLMWRGGPGKFLVVDRHVAAYRYHDLSKTCAGEDVFALEEFGVLTDWAVAQSGWELPPTVKEIRNACGFPPEPAGNMSWKRATPAEIQGAWLERMVVDDSLLYRASRKIIQGKKKTRFDRTLDELKPDLQAKFPGHFEEIRRTALLRAMQIERRMDPAMAWDILRSGAGFGEWRELTRLALRP